MAERVAARVPFRDPSHMEGLEAESEVGVRVSTSTWEVQVLADVASLLVGISSNSAANMIFWWQDLAVSSRDCPCLTVMVDGTFY